MIWAGKVVHTGDTYAEFSLGRPARLDDMALNMVRIGLGLRVPCRSRHGNRCKAKGDRLWIESRGTWDIFISKK